MTIVSRVDRCFCECHRHDDSGGAFWKYGCDSRDFAACVLACEKCRANHAAVLDEPPSRPLPQGDTSTVWQGDGEGSE